MRALLKLINLHFWKSIIGPFFAFGFPLIFVAILGIMIGYDLMFASLISLSSVAVALGCMPQAIFEFKQSTLLKRIGVTPIKSWMFMLVAGGYYVIIMLIGTILTFIFSLAIFSGNMHVGREIAKTISSNIPVISMSVADILGNTNWFGFIWSILMCIIVSTSLGMMIVSVSKSLIMVSGVAIPILIIMQFLSGQSLPISMVRPNEVLWYASYVTPLKPSVSLLIQSFQGNWITAFSNTYQITPTGSINIFDINNEFHVMGSSDWTGVVFSKTENILNLILPFIWTGLFSFICVKKFKWSVHYGTSMKIKFTKTKDSKINIDASPQILQTDLNNFTHTKSTESYYIPTPASDLSSLIKVNHVIKSFGKMHGAVGVLKDVSFTINEGEHIALLGSNGAGKSTLLNIIVGLIKADSGSVEHLYPYKNNYLEEIGMQFQDSSYPKGITTKNVIDFMLEVYNTNIEENELFSIMEIFSISELLNRNISSLSGGQQQRINALLAIIHKPRVAFLDELSAGLDILARKKITSFILDFCNSNGITLCIVSHDIPEIEYFAKRIVLIENGMVAVNASKEEVINKFGSLEQFVGLYIH